MLRFFIMMRLGPGSTVSESTIYRNTLDKGVDDTESIRLSCMSISLFFFFWTCGLLSMICLYSAYNSLMASVDVLSLQRFLIYKTNCLKIGVI